MSEAPVLAIGTSQTFRQQVARALDASPDDIGWASSVTAAEEIVTAGGPGHVLVVAPTVAEPDALGLAEFVARSAPATAIVLVRDRAMDGLLPRAMRAGIRDVVDLSKGGQDLRDALERATAWASRLQSERGESERAVPTEKGTLISVFASKGGTGKTFLATNLATAISMRTEQDTAVLDLDFGMGDVFSYFGQEPARSVGDLVGLPDEATGDMVRAMGTPLRDHLWGYGAPPDPSAKPVAGEAVGKLIRSLRSVFPYLVIDAGDEYSDQTLAAFDLSDTVLLVTGLDVVGVRHLSQALQTLLSIGLPRDRFRVVLNRADSKVGLEPREVERVMDLRVDALIPSSRSVPISLNKGEPVILREPKVGVSRAVAALADKLVAELGGAPPVGSAAAVPAEKLKRRMFGKSKES